MKIINSKQNERVLKRKRSRKQILSGFGGFKEHDNLLIEFQKKIQSFNITNEQQVRRGDIEGKESKEKIQMMQENVNAIRSRYLGNMRGDGEYTCDPELDIIYKKKAIQLELEMEELRKEKAQLMLSNEQLKNSETLRNGRMTSVDGKRQYELQRERDDLMRDLTDLARGNRLLSQENEILSTKYSNLLDVHNKVMLNSTNAAQLSEVYSTQLDGRSRMLKDFTKDKWQEFSELTNDYEANKRKINEMYATLKGKLMHLNTDSSLGLDSKEQWKNYTLDLQQVFDQVFRLSQDQSDLHSKIMLNSQQKNRELQNKLDEMSKVTSVQVNNNQNTSNNNSKNQSQQDSLPRSAQQSTSNANAIAQALTSPGGAAGPSASVQSSKLNLGLPPIEENHIEDYNTPLSISESQRDINQKDKNQALTATKRPKSSGEPLRAKKSGMSSSQLPPSEIKKVTSGKTLKPPSTRKISDSLYPSKIGSPGNGSRMLQSQTPNKMGNSAIPIKMANSINPNKTNLQATKKSTRVPKISVLSPPNE